jgi:hypothetical protein
MGEAMKKIMRGISVVVLAGLAIKSFYLVIHLHGNEALWSCAAACYFSDHLFDVLEGKRL